MMDDASTEIGSSSNTRIEPGLRALEGTEYSVFNIGNALVVGKRDLATSSQVQRGIKPIVEYIKKVAPNRMTEASCHAMTLRAFFDGIAQFSFERVDRGKDTGVLGTYGLHDVAGTTLDTGVVVAFDVIARENYLKDETTGRPIAETVFFVGRTEEEVGSLLGSVLGRGYQRVNIEDSPYNRKTASEA